MIVVHSQYIATRKQQSFAILNSFSTKTIKNIYI